MCVRESGGGRSREFQVFPDAQMCPVCEMSGFDIWEVNQEDTVQKFGAKRCRTQPRRKLATGTIVFPAFISAEAKQSCPDQLRSSCRQVNRGELFVWCVEL